MKYYDQDIFAYDAIGDLQFKGIDAYQKHWAFCLEKCSGQMLFEQGELAVHVDGKVALHTG